jgi:hypothetical protein
MGTTCGRTSLILNYTRVITPALPTGIMGIEFTPATTVIITTTIEADIIMRPLSKNGFYKVRPRKDHRGVDLISDALPFGGLWYEGPATPRLEKSNRNEDLVLPFQCLFGAPPSGSSQK